MDASSKLKSVSSLQTEPSFHLVPTLVRLIALKDRATLQHSNRVHALTSEWAAHMRARWQWSEIDFTTLETAALLHDVGKIGVLDEVLSQPSFLSEAERDHLQQHSEIGYQMVRDDPQGSAIALGIRHHHERWDGKGYPLGLKQAQIPMISQIIALVDTYDAIVGDRPYRPARTPAEALAEIAKEAGHQFNPELATAFIEFMHARNT